jgi:hypothetical protein
LPHRWVIRFSDEGVNLTIEWLNNGEIGEVRKVELSPTVLSGLKDLMYLKVNGFPIPSTGIFLSARLRCVRTTAFILPGTGEAGGISEQELLAIWPAIFCILFSRD